MLGDFRDPTDAVSLSQGFFKRKSGDVTGDATLAQSQILCGRSKQLKNGMKNAPQCDTSDTGAGKKGGVRQGDTCREEGVHGDPQDVRDVTRHLEILAMCEGALGDLEQLLLLERRRFLVRGGEEESFKRKRVCY